MVIDGGNNRDELADYLLGIGEAEIDIVVASHPDADHIRGLIRIVEEFSPEEIWVNGEARATSVAQEFDTAAAASGATVEVGRRGDFLQLGTLTIQVLHPVVLGSDSNDNSLVLRLDSGESSGLLTGDLEAAGEAELIAAGVELDIDLLKVGHHGSRSSTSAPFLAATTPDLAVYSALEGNRFGHPHAETLRRLEDAGVATFGTRNFGTIIAEPDGTSWSLRGLEFEEDGTTQTVALQSPWNLVTAAQGGPVSEVFTDVPELLGVFRWNPAAQRFDSWRLALPAALNSLQMVEAGDVLWLHVAAPATWRQAAFAGERRVNVLAGWNTVGWTGPDTAASAVAALLGAMRILAFDAGTQRFQTFDPALPAALNSLPTVTTGAGFWALLVSPTTVTIPAPGTSPDPPQPDTAGAVIRITTIFFDGLEPVAEGDEYVEFRNDGANPADLSGWLLISLVGDQRFTFPAGVAITPGQTCRVYTDEFHPEWCGLSFESGVAIWRNSGDEAELRDASGAVIDRYVY